ncbi:MAG: alpha-glucan family phosphorylase [Egibacteraceae bacterium]
MIKALRTFRVRPLLPAELQPLSDLALNLRWAWHPPTRELFRWADPDTWEEVGQNPVAFLGRLAPERMAALIEDAAFADELAAVHGDLRRYLDSFRWAQRQAQRQPRIAYFSPEFGLTHAMQTYSGGLGVLAGDHLKAASDLGLHLTGVGLLYRQGYFRQYLDADGWQQERYPDLNPYGLPLQRLEAEQGPALVEVEFAGRVVACQIWRAQVGRIPLLLLDTDLPQNAPEDRTVTDKLYGGDTEHRLQQEIVLGIGGVRALDVARGLRAVGSPPEVFHSNEGHAGFLQLERIRRLVVEEGLSFDEAIESARAAVVFTTHTPVPAGIDVFPRMLMEQYFEGLARECRISMDRLMAIGQPDGADPQSHFNMAVMGLRLSACANGVSQLHGRVSRIMFSGLWPGIDASEVPITSVTNGVHAATWVGPEMAGVYNRYLPPDWAHNPTAWSRAAEIGDDVLWRARGRARERMVQHIRACVRAQRERHGEPASSLAWTDEIFDPDALTIGFARRFAEYKRGTLLLRQPERLQTLLESTERPVQFVFAGKAHPRDNLGKSLIRELVHYSSDPQLRGRIVFVEDYDIELAQILYQGCDLWLNNPRRPYEACGTSGQKAVLNGALHCSTLDGWWDEMYDGENGFAIGGVDEHADAGQQDAADAQALFDLLERTVIPMFYNRAEGPLPRGWLGRVRRSIATLCPRVLATRMVVQYTTDLYSPVAEHARRLTADGNGRAKVLATWRARLARCWDEVRVLEVTGGEGAAEIGERRELCVTVQLGALTPGEVRVELLHGAVRADGLISSPHMDPLTCEGLRETSDPDLPDGEVPPGALELPSDGIYHYRGSFDLAVSGEYGLTLRIVPYHDDLVAWADTGLVAWADEAALMGDGR